MSELYIGLMSGTSLDGVDAVLVDWQGGQQRVLAHHYLPFTPSLHTKLLSLNQASSTQPGGELHTAALAGNEVAQLYALCVQAILSASASAPSAVRAIGAHGQTVRHQPLAQAQAAMQLPGYTIQLLNPALLAELTGVAVVADFRSRDVAAGGQGAPLVPAFHQALWSQPGACLAVLNIGGFSNLTVLDARAAPPQVVGFDCGPGNVLMDAWVQAHEQRPFDAQGTWGAQGRVIEGLLGDLLSDAYFSLAPPKSTGRDDFHMGWLQQHLRGYASAVPVDVQATLCELTAQSIAADVRRHAAAAQELIVCGGGAHNTFLLTRLAAHLPQLQVLSSAQRGLPPTQVEACAFAWLARQHVLGLPSNLPSVTGARGPRILGAHYPA